MADQFRVLRYAGAVASAGLATGAWLAGALPVPGADEVLHERGFGAMPALFNGGVAVSLAAAAGWLLVWWRLLVTGAVTGDGTRVGAGDPDPPGGSGGRWPRPRWVAATGLVWAFPLLLAPPLAARDVYSYACQGWLHVDGADPYGVGPAAGACPWLESVAPLWRHTTAPYGPLGIEASSAAVWPATAVPLDLPGRLLLAITLLRVVALVGVGLAGWGAVRLAGACGVPPGPALLAGVVSPLMAIHAVSGAHNDALLAGLILSGLAVLATGSLGTGPPGTGSLGTGSLGNHRAVAVALAGGAVLGLAAAIKITSVIVVPFAAILVAGRCPAAGRYLRSRVIAGVLAGAAGTYAAMMWLTGLGLGWLGSLRSTAD
ncbi:MAG: polyprenol phosphomannose-dependent alpha 1,6 mannosyltransferase MptB, partial [Dactylosporangium sp.]|nr:polyprenol phosphomannose-dependent alpha 1,6 mannosyltransferase MptB [Dactylosporangium sp.]